MAAEGEGKTFSGKAATCRFGMSQRLPGFAGRLALIDFPCHVLRSFSEGGSLGEGGSSSPIVFVLRPKTNGGTKRLEQMPAKPMVRAEQWTIWTRWTMWTCRRTPASHSHAPLSDTSDRAERRPRYYAPRSLARRGRLESAKRDSRPLASGCYPPRNVRRQPT